MSVHSLLDDQFAPTTSTVCFIKASLDRVADEFTTWHKGLGDTYSRMDLDGDLITALQQIAPLTAPSAERVLLLETRSEWTAFLDNHRWGTDPAATMYLSNALDVARVRTVSDAHTYRSKDQTGQYGSVQLTLKDPNNEEVRWISATNDGGRWAFETSGTPMSFETPEAYEARRIRDRFPPALLNTYCEALGIRLFDEAFYGPRGVLISDLNPPPGTREFDLADEQRDRLIGPFRR